jgi:hypothetical protein
MWNHSSKINMRSSTRGRRRTLQRSRGVRSSARSIGMEGWVQGQKADSEEAKIAATRLPALSVSLRTGICSSCGWLVSYSILWPVQGGVLPGSGWVYVKLCCTISLGHPISCYPYLRYSTVRACLLRTLRFQVLCFVCISLLYFRSLLALALEPASEPRTWSYVINFLFRSFFRKQGYCRQ